MARMEVVMCLGYILIIVWIPYSNTTKIGNMDFFVMPHRIEYIFIQKNVVPTNIGVTYAMSFG